MIWTLAPGSRIIPKLPDLLPRVRIRESSGRTGGRGFSSNPDGPIPGIPDNMLSSFQCSTSTLSIGPISPAWPLIEPGGTFSGVDSERSKTYVYRQQAEFVFDEKIGVLEATARITPSSRILMIAKLTLIGSLANEKQRLPQELLY